jgi:glycosyltransferase involved in cell wall biosynthesis
MEDKKPLLSVIIPTFNEEKNLPKLLKTVAEQTFRDFEIVVADSPKTVDKTKAVAASFGCRVVDGGLVSEGRNNGARAASGKVFLFLDADVALPNKFFLEDTVNEFIGRDLDLATCRVRAMDGGKYDKLMHDLYNVYSVALGKILPHIPGFCFFIKRSVYEAVGGFDIDIKLAEDHELARRGSKIGTFGFLFSQCIPVSTRRFERDGRFATAVKYVLCELHMLTLGPVKSDIFKYEWGHGQKKEAAAAKHGK